jgi:hypothetical protein
MSRRQTLGRWLSTSDAALSWGERIVKWLVLGLSSGTVTGLAGTAIGALTNNLVYGLVIGVVLGLLILGAFTLKAISIAAAGAPPQPISEKSQAQVREVEQEREQAQTDKRALQQELEQTKRALEQARVDASGFGAHTLEQEDSQAVIERLTAERDELKSRGIPQRMVAERHIRYHETPIRLVDLLEIAGDNGVLRDFKFEHCILEGPGIINLEEPFPESESGKSGSGLTLYPTDCRVEGTADATLYQITRGETMPIGVVHLSKIHA